MEAVQAAGCRDFYRDRGNLSTMELVDALAAESGTVSVVGAGGKKSTMYLLAGQLDRALVTATVRIPIFDPHVAEVVVTDDPAGAIAAAEHWPLGVVPGREGPDRYIGYEPTVIDGLHGIDPVETILVKADGARMRKLKAPNEREPRIPHTSDTVIPIVSAHVIGEPLDERLVHRVDLVAALAGLEVGDTLSPAAVAAVMTHPEGGMKEVPDGATVVPVVNMVDTETLRYRARSTARAILDRSDVPRVVLARMTGSDPVVEVVR